MTKTKDNDLTPPSIPSPVQAEPRPIMDRPYLSMAIIAEAILVERDNRTSIIRIVDRVSVAPDTAASLQIDEIASFALVLFVSFRACGYSGKSHLLIVQIDPSGDSEPIGMSEFHFNGTLRDLWEANLPLSMRWKGPGQYWVDVYLDNKLYSRIPFEIAIDGQPTVKQ